MSNRLVISQGGRVGSVVSWQKIETVPQNYFYKPYLENGVRYVALDDTKYLDVKQVDGVESDGGMETQEVRYE